MCASSSVPWRDGRASLMPLEPRRGVRILLELVEAEATSGAHYRGAILTPEGRTDFDVRIDATAHVTVTESAPFSGARATPVDPGDRGRELLRNMARTVGKHALLAEKNRGAVWPRRVLRWRRS